VKVVPPERMLASQHFRQLPIESNFTSSRHSAQSKKWGKTITSRAPIVEANMPFMCAAVSINRTEHSIFRRAWLTGIENGLCLRISLLGITRGPPSFRIFADIHRPKSALHHLPREAACCRACVSEGSDCGF